MGSLEQYLVAKGNVSETKRPHNLDVGYLEAYDNGELVATWDDDGTFTCYDKEGFKRAIIATLGRS